MHASIQNQSDISGLNDCNAHTSMECLSKGCTWEKPDEYIQSLVEKSYSHLAQEVCPRLSPGNLNRDAICTAVCPPEGLTGCFYSQDEEASTEGNRIRM